MRWPSSLWLLAFVGCGGAGSGDRPPPADEIRQVGTETCAGVGDLRFICDIISPEDFAIVPESDWVIASGNQEGGRIQAIHAGDKRPQVLFPTAARRERFDRSAYPTCPGPIDAAEGDEFRAHGLYLRPGRSGIHTLYVVHHGRRESVEVFEVDARGGTPLLTWVGCAVAPEGAVLNAVVALPNGGVAATATRLSGEIPNGVLEWHAETGWTIVAGSENVGPNGLEISAAGDRLYVAAWMAEQLLSLSRGEPEVHKEVVQLGFRPDNLRMAPDGLIYAAGHTDFGLPTEGSNVARIDPETLEFERIFQQPYVEGFAVSTVAIPVGGDIWMGTNRGNRIAFFPAP